MDERQSLNIDQATVDSLFALYKGGDFSDLAARARSLLSSYPNALVLHSLLGAAQLELGNYADAVTSYQAALRIRPDFAKIHNSLGIAYLRQQRYDDALASFQHAIDNNPQFAAAWFNLGIIYEHRRQWQPAAKHYRQAAQLDPDNVEALTSLATVLWEQGDYHLVSDTFEHAIAIKEDHVPAWRGLMNFLEQSNESDALRAALVRAREVIGEHAIVRLYEGVIADIDGDYQRARSTLEGVQVDPGDPATIHDERRIAARLTRVCDRLNDTEAAMGYATTANSLSRELGDAHGVRKETFLEYIEARRRYFIADNLRHWPVAPSYSGDPPIFIVGFPRSGTTLLDTILRSHPQIAVAEEANAISRIVEDLGTLSGNELNHLARLTEHDIERLRKLYFDTLEDHIEDGHTAARLIDRFAVNIIYAGEIYRLFPGAKFIVMRRHPADCVLSCFMQLFYESPANANFYTLEDAANLYHRVFTLWHQYEQLLDPDVLYVSYEALIEDVEHTARSILKFIDMPWHPDLLHHERTARSRQFIKTASYNQVTRPVYSDACGRWRRYRRYMESVMPVLAPWISRYGYETLP